MNASVATSSDILDKKWHKITYEKHKKRVSTIRLKKHVLLWILKD